MMDQLSKNFDRSEFACQGKNCCGHSAPISLDLVDALQELRDRVNEYNRLTRGFDADIPLVVTSGYRCNVHNRTIHGASCSLHTVGLAADVMCPLGAGKRAALASEVPVFFDAEKLAALALEVPLFFDGGIGLYRRPEHRIKGKIQPARGWVHLDVRTTGAARWEK